MLYIYTDLSLRRITDSDTEKKTESESDISLIILNASRKLRAARVLVIKYDVQRVYPMVVDLTT